MENITPKQIAKLNQMVNTLHPNNLEHELTWLELCWLILNKLCDKRELSTVQIVNEIQLFGIVCFNRFESNHPIDYLYEIFSN